MFPWYHIWTILNLSVNKNSWKCALRMERFSFKRREVWMPIFVNAVLLFIQRWCGVSIIASYAVSILTETRSSIDEVPKWYTSLKYVTWYVKLCIKCILTICNFNCVVHRNNYIWSGKSSFKFDYCISTTICQKARFIHDVMCNYGYWNVFVRDNKLHDRSL